MKDRVEHYAEGLARIDAGHGPEWAPELAAAVRDGESPLDFSRRTGRSKSSCYELLNDPYGEKLRKRKGTYVCEGCGEEKQHDGSKEKPRMCWDCTCAERTEAARNNVLEAIQEWVALYGRPPTATDWNPAQWGRASEAFQREAMERGQARKWPHVSGVQSLFGSWNAAIEAAGFEPVASGQSRAGAAGKSLIE